MPFLDRVTQMMDTESKSGRTTRNTSVNAATRKAAIKKKALARKKTVRES